MQHLEFNQMEIAPSKKTTWRWGEGKSTHRCSVLVISEVSITEHRIHKNYMFSGKLAGVACIVCSATSNQALFRSVYFPSFL
jgi:hypothetical protein